MRLPFPPKNTLPADEKTTDLLQASFLKIIQANVLRIKSKTGINLQIPAGNSCRKSTAFPAVSAKNFYFRKAPEVDGIYRRKNVYGLPERR